VVRWLYEWAAPERVRFLDVSEAEAGGNLLKWDPVVDKDLCYYRVYRMNMPRYRFARKTQIGSTAATHFVDSAPPEGKKSYYAVIAVDNHDNHFQ
jgi:fibronectin type 3 domain-containing protein